MTAPTDITTASRDFFDANVLVYAYDPRNPAQQRRA